MAEEVWMLQTKKADFKQIGARFRIDPVTARIIRNRGIEGEAAIDRYLNGTLDDLYDPMLLKDMERAVSILCEAVDTGKKIRIVGDYDIDGVCSTYILLQAFERLGSDVDFEIPDRIKDGYGINESIIEQAHADGVEVILTCDNGISAFHQVELAKKYGMTVVITDHHEVPLDGEKEKIPPADAVIDPKQADCPYPFQEICGAVVAYKLVQVLYARRGVPQIEVTFDIDANGIVHVSAKDKGTGKEQSMTITGGSGLPKDEIDRMVKEAEAHEAEDKKRKEDAETRNQAEAFAYSTEKLVNDNKDKLSDDIVKEVTDKVNALKEALKGDDTEKVKTAQTELMTAAQKIGQVLYAQQGAEGAAAGADGAGASAGSASGSDDDTVEAEVVDDDDDKDNK